MKASLWLKGVTAAAAVSAAAVALPAMSGIASASTTSGNGSVLGGNQVNLPISVPVNACGNAVAILGLAGAGCQGGASVQNSGNGPLGTTGGNGSIGGGNQINAPVSVPVDVCGNAVGAVLGTAGAGCKGGASVTNSSGSKHAGGWGNQDPSHAALQTSNSNYQGKHRSSGATTSGNGSILGGNQINAPVSVPVDVCGNAIAVLGYAAAGCQGGASVGNAGSAA